MEKIIINPWQWQDQYGYVQAREIKGQNETLICSGQTPNDDNGKPMHEGDMEAQIELAFDNIEVILKEAGWNIADIVHIKYYTLDVDLFIEKSGPLMERLKKAHAATTSTLLGVSRLAFPEFLIEIEVLAMR